MTGSIIESMMMKKTHLNIYVLLVHPYFSATDDTWHIALRLVVHTEAVGVPQSTCAVSHSNDCERSGNTQHMKGSFRRGTCNFTA